MLIFYAFTGERMIEILNEPITLLFFRSSSIILYLGALEVLLYIIRKYDIRNIPYFSIVIPILTLTFLIGNCILSLALYNEIKQMMGTAVVTVLISILLLLWILKTIQIEFKKKSITIFQNEIEQQYQVLLEDYLNITDTELLQKYVRHDLLNHLQVLNEIKKEDKE